MQKTCWVIFQDGRRWRIGRKTADALSLEDVVPKEATEESAPNEAASIAETLQTLGYKGENVLLALDSARCLAASFVLDNPAAKRQPQTLLYQLEQFLPLAAEDLVADFVIDGCDTLGVALAYADVKSLLDGLEEAGVHVQSLSPTALLALQHYVRNEQHSETRLILWQHDDHIEWLRLSAVGKLLAWRLLPVESPSLVQNLRIELLDRTEPLNIFAIDLPPTARNAISALPGVQLQEAECRPLQEAAMTTAETVLDGGERPWIELRRNELEASDRYRAVRGPLQFVMASAVALLIAMIGGFSYRAYCYDRLAEQKQQRQMTAFHEIFPGQPAPQGIRSRLESEHAKMAGLKGASSQLPSQASAFNMLYDVLASLPDGMRYRFHELRLDRQHAFLDGELLSHSDADGLSAGLRRHGLEVQPPRTQQLPGQGVSIRITAEVAQKAPTGAGVVK